MNGLRDKHLARIGAAEEVPTPRGQQTLPGGGARKHFLSFRAENGGLSVLFLAPALL